jgi:LmbE family N-acetylglucosaminyl deacetylase
MLFYKWCFSTISWRYLRPTQYADMRKNILTLLRCFLFALIIAGIGSKTYAQAPPTYSSADIYLQLQKLNVLGSVLYIAAHPDDENTRLLAYLAKEKQYRTGYLSLTRGDGGQNLIGDEQGIELGLIRTQELLAARRIDGAEQFFSRAFDFGFCKTAKEAMDTWGHDKILSDVVWVIRKFQPDVIITRFPGDERAGHGHHQASNLLAVEAFAAAADPNKFPEQLQYVQPWQAKRILWNTFNFGTTNTTDSTQFKMDVGVYNNLLGKSYGEIASESRSQHKSQGFGVPRQRGQAMEFFKPLAGAPIQNNLMNDITTTWQRVAGGDEIQQQINQIIAGYSFEHPENSVASLTALYKTLVNGTAGYWQQQKAEEVKKLIIACSGIFAEATANAEYAVMGDSIKVQLFINKRNNAPVTLTAIKINEFDSSIQLALETNKNNSFYKTVATTNQATQPYWLAKPIEKGSYDVENQELIGKTESDGAYNAIFTFSVNGTLLPLKVPVKYKYTDPVKGELYEPVVNIAPVIVSAMPAVMLTNILPGNAATANPMMQVKYKANIKAADVKLSIHINQGTTVVYTKDTTVNFETGKTFTNSIAVKKIFRHSLSQQLTVDITTTIKGVSTVYSSFLRTIQYDHIPHINYTYRDNVKVINDTIKTTGKKIGYITGAGDKVPQALTQMGYNVTLLNEAAITPDNLKQFDAVIAGIRAYNTQDWLTGKYDILMAYIKAGGNYIVQYNTNNFISNVSDKIGPYPFTISRTRVTDENATVQIQIPKHSVLHYPNTIGDKDFTGWMQERSIYHAEKIDSRYETPFLMNDANEPASNGSLIIGKYGKGNFVYTGLVFFRELPAGVPGAYKIMANLIALPKTK